MPVLSREEAIGQHGSFYIIDEMDYAYDPAKGEKILKTAKVRRVLGRIEEEGAYDFCYYDEDDGWNRHIQNPHKVTAEAFAAFADRLRAKGAELALTELPEQITLPDNILPLGADIFAIDMNYECRESGIRYGQKNDNCRVVKRNFETDGQVSYRADSRVNGIRFAFTQGTDGAVSRTITYEYFAFLSAEERDAAFAELEKGWNEKFTAYRARQAQPAPV